MTRKQFAACVLTLSLVSAGNALGSVTLAENGAHYTKAQLKQMIREAHAPEQYRALAQFYDEKQKLFLQRADKERQEWEQLSENASTRAGKYPRPVDWARYQYEYDMEKATKARGFSIKYSQLVEAASISKAQ